MGSLSLIHWLILGVLCLGFLAIPALIVGVLIWLLNRKD